ncbi:hypothetical protein QTP88_019241 [Uroleucon formosanum]
MKPAPSGSGTKKKPYCLAEAMQFTIPYIKTLSSTTGNVPNIPEENENQVFKENDDLHDSQPLSPPQPSTPNIPITSVTSQPYFTQYANSTETQSQPTTRPKNKRAFKNDAVDKTFIEYLEAKKSKIDRDSDPNTKQNTKTEALKMSDESNGDFNDGYDDDMCVKILDNAENAGLCNVTSNTSDIEIAPGIYVPDIPAESCNQNTMLSNEKINKLIPEDGDDLCMNTMDEFENTHTGQDYYTTIGSKRTHIENTQTAVKAKKVRLQKANSIRFEEIRSAHNQFYESITPALLETFNTHNLPIKFNLKIESTDSRPNVENSSENRAFKTLAREIFVDSNVPSILEESFNKLKCEEKEYTSKGSGFSFQHIHGMLLGILTFSPMSGSSYLPLPASIDRKRATINHQNSDQQCFKWAILAKHVTEQSKYRVGVNYYQHIDKYNFDGISFPTPLSDVKIFERNNSTVSINIYGIEKKFQPPLKFPPHTVFPLKVVDNEKEDHFDILFITDSESSHYVYISKLSRLYKLKGQMALDQHKKVYGIHKPILPVLPTEEKKNQKKGKNTTIFQEHKPMSFGLKVVASEDVPLHLLDKFDISTMPIIFRGCKTQQEVAKKFIEEVTELTRKIEKLLKRNESIIMSKEDWCKHRVTLKCDIRGGEKVRDHCHLSGKFRHTLCNKCNLDLQQPNFVPCFLHNLMNYDAHFIVTELRYDSKTISVIPNSEEKFISFSKYVSNTFTVRFIDTFRFMPSSLSNLAANLVTPNLTKFRETSKVFRPVDMSLVTRKGVYPYEYTDSWEKLDETSLPSMNNFYSSLIESNIDNTEYQHALEAPGMAFDCMLKKTAIKLELLTDYDMVLSFENGNNLYGWAMSEYMPFGDFKWVEPSLSGLDDLDDTSPIGRIYEVDVIYPQELHDHHNDLPFLPENGIPAGSKVKKLMATFESKKKYIVHYRNLQQAIKNGLKVEKVHRVLQFKQSPWLAEYISMNTEMRKMATNDFEKEFFKLMNNAVFGKTMESVRKRIKIELVSCPRRFQKLVNKSTFKHATTYNENLSSVSLENKIIDFCKPIYIGFAVLEISKTLMYDYHYNIMKKHYKDNINLMYTDTDSLIYYIKTDDFYTDLIKNPNLLDRMDTANLPRDHPCYIANRKKVPGFFSDETDGHTMTEFCALRAKSYAYKIIGKDERGDDKTHEKIKTRGIRGHVVKKHMTLEDHKKCLFGEDGVEVYKENVSIRSFKHQIKTIKSNKLTYNSYDDKRVVLADKINTLAHGHYSIDEDEPDDVWSELDSEVDAEGVKWSKQDKDLMRTLSIIPLT